MKLLDDLKEIEQGPRLVYDFDGKISVIVPYTPGNGHFYPVEISYLADVPKGPDRVGCAFCHGDPCNEQPIPGSLIARYYEDTSYALTCPMCDGRPS